MTSLPRGTMPKPGTIGLTRIQGWMGWFVWLLQLLNGDASKWTHVFVVLDNGEVFEAMPGGAKISPLSRYIDIYDSTITGKQLWQPVAGREVCFLAWEMPDDVRRDMCEYARMELVDIPYNWGTYLYMAAYRLHLPVSTWLFHKYVMRSERLICSQAADFLYVLYGQHLFNDGRRPFDVTPGDIGDLIKDRPTT